VEIDATSTFASNCHSLIFTALVAKMKYNNNPQDGRKLTLPPNQKREAKRRRRLSREIHFPRSSELRRASMDPIQVELPVLLRTADVADHCIRISSHPAVAKRSRTHQQPEFDVDGCMEETSYRRVMRSNPEAWGDIGVVTSEEIRPCNTDYIFEGRGGQTTGHVPPAMAAAAIFAYFSG
jgi:hypothetical protein